MVTICCLINLISINNETTFDTLNMGISITLMTVLTIATVVLTVILFKNFKKLNQQEYEDMYGSLYNKLRLKDNKLVLLHSVYYLIRRITFPMVVIFTDKLCYQFIAVQVYYLASVWIIGYLRPFDDPSVLKTEIFNEVVMLMILMCMIGFSDIVPTVESQFIVGYICSFIIGFHLVANILLIAKVSVKGLIMRIKKWRLIIAHRKKHKI